MSRLSSDEVRPHIVADALRRHPLLMIGCAVVLALLVAVLTNGQPAAYTSSAKVLIRPTIGNPFAPDTGSSGQQVTIAMETESQIVNSVPVAALAKTKLKAPWVAGSDTVVASVPPNTQVIQIAFTAPTPEEAQNGAQVVAQSYLGYRSAQSASTQKARRDILTKQAAAVQTSLTAASKAASAANASPEAAQQVQLFANQLVSIQTSISTLESSGADPGSIISPAVLPTKPGGLSPVLLAIVGGLIGLVGGLIMAIWLERRDKRLRAKTDTAVGSVPVLAHLGAGPHSVDIAHDDSMQSGRRGRVRQGVDGPRAAFQRLATATLTSTTTPASIAVSAISDGAESGYVAVHLAQALQRAGYSVAVVSAENSGWIESELSLETAEGLREALLTQASVRSLVVNVDGLKVLPAGRSLQDAEALLFSERFVELIHELQRDSDFVLVSAPHADVPAGMGIGVATDSMVLVGTDRRTTSSEVEAAAIRAERLGVTIMGLVAVPRARRSLLGRKRTDDTASTSAHHVAPEAGRTVEGPTGDEQATAPELNRSGVDVEEATSVDTTARG